MIVLSSHVDFSEVYAEDAVKYTTDYNTYFLLDRDHTQTVDYFYSESTIKLDNEAFQMFWPSQEKGFFEYFGQAYHRSDMDFDSPLEDQVFLSFVIQKAEKTRLYNR